MEDHFAEFWALSCKFEMIGFLIAGHKWFFHQNYAMG